MRRLCENCGNWEREDDKNGYCHARPPSLIVSFGDGNQTNLTTQFPPTPPQFWCGLHRHKGWRRLFDRL